MEPFHRKGWHKVGISARRRPGSHNLDERSASLINVSLCSGSSVAHRGAAIASERSFKQIDDPYQILHSPFQESSLTSIHDEVAAAIEALHSGGDALPHLILLQTAGTQEVFDAMKRLLDSSDAIARLLAILVLREFDSHGEDGRRPFREATIPLLNARLAQESDDEIIGWLISALGSHGAKESLDAVIGFAQSQSTSVRFKVASTLPYFTSYFVDQEQTDPRVTKALELLCRDDDADVRWYALAGLQELNVLPAEIAETLENLRSDPDEQIRELVNSYSEGEGEAINV